jgi:hypothetical protein
MLGPLGTALTAAGAAPTAALVERLPIDASDAPSGDTAGPLFPGSRFGAGITGAAGPGTSGPGAIGAIPGPGTMGAPSGIGAIGPDGGGTNVVGPQPGQPPVGPDGAPHVPQGAHPPQAVHEPHTPPGHEHAPTQLLHGPTSNARYVVIGMRYAWRTSSVGR